MNIADAILSTARGRPDHPAIEDGDRVVSYAMLAAMVDHAAARLRSLGVGMGDMVVVSLPDSAKHVAVLLALAKIGAVSFSLDPQSPQAEHRGAVQGLPIRCAIVAAADRFLEIETLALDTVCAAAPAGVRQASGADAAIGFDPDWPLMVIQSSGTTGAPKRLLLSHRQMAERNRRSLALLGLSAADRYFQAPALRFFDGRRRCLKMLSLGGTVVLDHGPSIDDYPRWFTGRRITYAYLTPYHLRALLANVRGEGPLWPELRLVLGMAPSTPADRSLARQRLTPLIFDSYGTNEIGTVAISTPADQDIQPHSIGRPIEGIAAQIADQDGQILPPGQVGLIGFRAPHFARAYLGNAEATARHFKDGWFYPGDFAVMDDAGYIFLRGRADDVINCSGAKYFPAEVEVVLSAHPAVAEVAVVGAPHPLYGEVSVAYVVRAAAVSSQELNRFCEGKIAMFKAPYWVVFLSELPRVPPGKPDRKALRAMFGRYLEEQAR